MEIKAIKKNIVLKLIAENNIDVGSVNHWQRKHSNYCDGYGSYL